ncbi:MAG: hypothetical protein RTU30_15755 [Candidatus Thorarchaeota archaeon]
MGDSVDWLSWTSGFVHSEAQWGVAMFIPNQNDETESTPVQVRVEIRVEPIIDSNEWLLFKGWTFPPDNRTQAQEWFDECVRRLGILDESPEGHPAIILADDELQITDEFRIQVFEEWLTGARAAFSQ